MKSNIQGQYAGAVTRGVGFLIDLFLISITLAVSSWLVYSTFALIGIDLTKCPPMTSADFAISVCNITRVGLAFYVALFAPVYALFFWTVGGQTIGMGILGVRVVRTDGKPLTLINSLRRLIGFAICLLTLGIGFAKMLIDNQRQGLHDSIAGTYVIYAWRGEQDLDTIAQVQAWMARRKKKDNSSATNSA